MDGTEDKDNIGATAAYPAILFGRRVKWKEESNNPTTEWIRGQYGELCPYDALPCIEIRNHPQHASS